LERIVREKLLTASGVYGFWPAAAEDDDVVIYRDAEHLGELARFPMLRQQETMASGQPNLSLADFVRPANPSSGRSGDTAQAEFIGAFAVTAGLGADDLARRFERERDDYSAILVKALADRLAEAFATYLHRTALTEAGIRPAFGYPACPDHSEKFTLFSLLGASDAGMGLTEHAAMMPAASVSGLYFPRPQARDFPVVRLGEGHSAAYARRKG